jgi:pimeloyl-ACP methyl ester carboxylesterase
MTAIGRLVRGFGPWGDVWVRCGWRVQVNCTSGLARILDPAGRCIETGAEAVCLSNAASLAPRAGLSRGAVLLHGLLDDRQIMLPMAAVLEAAGWAVACLSYPSTHCPLQTHAEAASKAARALAEDGANEIAFVGHSMGGLVARAAVSRAGADGWRPGRLVLIGSPARGSSLARSLRRLPGYRQLLGPCGDDVTPEGAARVPMPAVRDVAVIAGGTGGAGFNPLLEGDNDFTVTVAETRLPGVETDFLLVRSLHRWLAAHRQSISATLAFLSTGRIGA